MFRNLDDSWGPPNNKSKNIDINNSQWTFPFDITKGSFLAGYLEFYFAKQRGVGPLILERPGERDPPSPPPQRELSPLAWWVSSRSSPFAVSCHHHHHHHQHHHHHHPPPHHHHHSTWNSDFSTSIFQVPNGAMKVTGSSIHRYRKKRHWSLC